MVQRRTLVTVLGSATVAAAALAFTGAHEGSSNTPYRDSGGKWTVCKGQTGVPMHYYTDAQCDAMLANTLVTVAGQIETSTPGYEALSDGAKTATLDFAYNVGVTAYNHSLFRTMLINKQLPAACNELEQWKLVKGQAVVFTKAAPKGSGYMDCSVRANNCYGVWQRRQAEKEMCTSGKLS